MSVFVAAAVGALKRVKSSTASARAALIAHLTANSLYALMYDLIDTTKLFQNTGGTTPVTTAGDPIRYVTELSGSGVPMIMAGSAAPLYQTTYAAFDGVDDKLHADAPATLSPYACLGIAFRITQKPGDTAAILRSEFAGIGGAMNRASLFVETDASDSKVFAGFNYETPGSSAYSDGSGTRAPINTWHSLVGIGRITGGDVKCRINDTVGTGTGLDTGATVTNGGTQASVEINHNEAEFPLQVRRVIVLPSHTAAHSSTTETLVQNWLREDF